MLEEDVDLTLDDDHVPNNSPSFKYKASFVTNRNGAKIAVTLKYLSNFWRSLEMPLIICKVELSFTWNKNCGSSSEDGNSIFAITDTKLYAPIVTLSAEDIVKLSKLLGEGFKRSIYWNKYRVIANKTYNVNGYIRDLLDSSCQGFRRLFVLACDNANEITPDSHKNLLSSKN